MAAEEVFLPFPAPNRLQVPTTTQVKGTWLASSLRAVRSHGRMESYLSHLSYEHRTTIMSSVTSDWHPIELLMAHYDACDRLEIPSIEIVQIGQEATKHAHGGVVGMAVKLAANTVVTPWTILSQLQKIWDRVFVGGGVGVYKLGPKEARLELVQFPCCRYHYCRIGFRGVVLGLTELVCQKAYVSDVPSLMTGTQAAMRLAWV